VLPDRLEKRTLLFLFLGGIFIFSCLIYLLPVNFVRGEQVFRGYYTVLVDASIPLQEVVEKAQRTGFNEILSYITAYTDYYDFGEYRSVLVSKLNMRFDDLDPRIDPYMRSVKNLFFTSFEGKDWNILYLKSSLSPFEVYSRVSHIFSRDRATFQVVEYDGLKQLLFLLFFVAFVCFIVLAFRSSRIYRILGILPWVTFPFSGSFSFLISSCFMYLGFSLCMEEWGPVFTYYLNYGVFDTRKGRAVEAGLVWASALAVSAVLVISSGQGLLGFIPVLIAFSGDAALFACEILRLTTHKLQQAHTLFFPVTILKTRGNPDPSRVIKTVVIGAFFLLSPLLVLFFDKGDIPIPAPVDVPQVHSFSLDETGLLFACDGTSNLPNISSYIAHRAYQEGLLSRGKYQFPQKDEELSVPFFTLDGNAIKLVKKNSIQFTEAWYKAIIHGNILDSVGVLLREQKKPYYLEMRSLKTVTGARFSVVRFLVLCLFIFAPMIPWCRSESSPFSLGAKSALIRRKQQTA